MVLVKSIVILFFLSWNNYALSFPLIKLSQDVFVPQKPMVMPQTKKKIIDFDGNSFWK